MGRWLTDRLFAPVDVASLVAFRVFFGTVVAMDLVGDIADGAVESRYLKPTAPFHYWGFDWVRPLPGWAVYAVHCAALLAAICIVVGLWYRVGAGAFFVGHTYLFLLSPEHYLNHQYLISILALLMVFLPAHRALSVDAMRDASLRSSRVHAWPLWLLCGLFSIVFLHAGLAKIDGDWLAGIPARSWLTNRAKTSVLGGLLTHDATVVFVAWGGLVFDLTAPALLLWHRTRSFAVATSAFFHLSNKYLFEIGVFPWLMLGATTLFLDPAWPRQLPRIGPALGAWLDDDTSTDRSREISPLRRRLVVAGMTSFLVVMFVVPLRHLAYPGDVGWNEDGHRFAWRMRLRNKGGLFSFRVRDRSTGDEWRVPASRFLTRRQVIKLPHSPDFVAQHARFLREHYAAAGMDVEVRVDGFVSLNGRPRRRFIDPTIDLSRVLPSLGPSHWVLPIDREPEEEGAPDDGETAAPQLAVE